jgi:hypothetical protein
MSRERFLRGTFLLKRHNLVCWVFIASFNCFLRSSFAEPPGLFGFPYDGNAVVASNNGRSTGYAYGESSTYSIVDAWFWDGNTTTQIASLLGGAYGEALPGYEIRFSAPTQLKASGHVNGYTKVFSNDGLGNVSHTGQVVWIYDPFTAQPGGTTTQIGLYGDDWEARNGIMVGYYSATSQMNEAGHAAGYSKLYYNDFSGSRETGQSAWIYNGTQTVRIGQIPDSIQYGPLSETIEHSVVQYLEGQSPRATGYSEIYTITAALTGHRGWYFDGETTRPISNDLFSHITSVSTFIAGATSTSAFGGIAGNITAGPRHDDVWLDNGPVIQLIGPTDAEYTAPDGSRYHYVSNAHHSIAWNGIDIVGMSDRFSPVGAWVGNSNWVYNGASTVRIGLTDAEHTRLDGFQYSQSTILNSVGQATGNSNRYNGNANSGNSVWLYDGASTKKIGLTDGSHTRADGFRGSASTAINNLGQVIGYSNRFSGSSGTGSSGWWYDPESEQTILIPSLSESNDGISFTEPNYLGGDELILGTYLLYSGSSYLGARPFYFRPGELPLDFGDLIGGDFNMHVWSGFDFTRVGDSQEFLVTARDDLFQVFQYEVSIPVAGDFNFDDAVDAADYVAWRKNGGTQTAFNRWRANFGATAGGSSGSALGQASREGVPEPASATLALLVAIPVVCASNRQRKFD